MRNSQLLIQTLGVLTPGVPASWTQRRLFFLLTVHKQDAQRSGTEVAGDNGGGLCDGDAVKPAQAVRLCFDLREELCRAARVGDEQLPFV